MTVEEIRAYSSVGNDRFPVGMRVLAVDDDPTCLRVLDGLLRNCHYKVTTTSQAKMALKMLRENRDRFDLVISDVVMPDMDGFRLLELVGLEMDLPVIMLSANSDTRLVMKGIEHGACDYLVKPVRIEELKNIWQHVIRRKKFESKSSTLDKAHQENGDGGDGRAPTDNADHNVKLNRKRKDEEEEEDDEEDGEENEDPATRKKPRVVWSMELHGKFVAAVNQLGIEKAVPKKILDMMNVEGITRENVASHLQKYRLYLRRISSMTTQRANMVAALGGNNSSSMHMSSLDRLRDFRTLSGSGRLSNSTLSSYRTGGILGRLSSPAGVSLRSFSSSALIQPSHAQNADLFQGIPKQLELDQLQQTKSTSSIGEFNSASNPSSFGDNIVPVGSSCNSLTSALGNPLLQTQCGEVFGNQSSFKVTSLNSEPFNTGVGGSNFLDNGRYNGNWQSSIEVSKFSSNTLPLSELPPNSMRKNSYSSGLHIQSGPLEFSSTNIISAPMENSRREIHCLTGFHGDFVQDTNLATDQRWGEHKLDYTQNSNHLLSTLNSMVPSNGVVGPPNEVLDQNNGVCNRKIDASLVSQSNGGASNLLQLSEMEKSAMGSQIRSSEDYHLAQTNSQGGFVHDGYDTLDDLMTEMIKQGQEGTVLLNGEFDFDAFSFGSGL